MGAARNINSVPIDESLINSGDFFGIIRLDGLDPMLAWAMGSVTGHTTVAIRDENNVLWITESNAKGSYWPLNGIQKTPYAQWIKQTQDANYNFLWAPLTPEQRAKFNSTAALEYFSTVEGVDYGYYNMLMAWIDTENDNYPCLPPEFSLCLQWEHFEIVIGILDSIAPSVMDMLFGQAFNHRINTEGLRGAEIFEEANKQGIANLRELPLIPEDDSWLYTIKRYNDTVQAPASVCCVYVCHIWKAGGLFEDIKNEINCGEMTNGDDYYINILDAKPQRPTQCAQADPQNALCQLEGKYQLTFNDYSSRNATAHMAEKCPSRAPNYDRPLGC